MSGFEVGQELDGKFSVVRVIGRGGMGTVYEVIHLGLDKHFALKTLLDDVAKREGFDARFVQEARAAARITSPHVCAVVDVGKLGDGTRYLLMELLRGKSVAQLLAQSGPLGVEQACDIVIEACDALAEAHGLGIVHRDIKPDNLFLALGSDGSVQTKVLDFGISKMTTSAVKTTSSSILGTPRYMAPEQLTASASIDGRADVWALGVSLYEMLSGKLPWTDDDFMRLAASILTAPPAHLARHVPDAPPELLEVVHRCLAKERQERFPSAVALASALAPFASHTGKALAERMSTPTHAAFAMAETGAEHPASAGSLEGISGGTQAASTVKVARRTRVIVGVAVVSFALGLGITARMFEAPKMDASSAHLRASLHTPQARLHAMAFSPGSGLLVTAGADSLRTLDLGGGGALRETPLEGVSRGFFSPDGEWYAGVRSDGAVRVYSTLAQLSAETFETRDALAVVPLDDGEGAVAVHADRALRLWRKGAPPVEIARFDSAPLVVRSSADGRRAVAGDAHGHFLSVDLGASKVLCRGRLGAASITAIAESDDGGKLAVADEAGHVGVYASETCSANGAMTVTAAVARVIFVPVSNALLVAHGKQLEHRSERGDVLATMRAHSETITSLAVSHDGKRAASGAANGEVRIWALD